MIATSFVFITSPIAHWTWIENKRTLYNHVIIPCPTLESNM